VRFLASIIVALVTSAIALLVAALLLDDFSISAGMFPVVVVVFAAILVVARAATETIVNKNAHVLSSFVGLIGAFIALLVTDLVSDNLTIEGFSTWVVATLIVWLGMVLANLLLARWLFRKITGRKE
jgi:hypothetical protein